MAGSAINNDEYTIVTWPDNGELILHHEEHGQQVWKQCVKILRQTHSCAITGDMILRNDHPYRCITNLSNKHDRISEYGIEILKKRKSIDLH